MASPSRRNPLPSRSATPTAAAAAILDVAEQLAQTRGYNGFSYADIALKLGVTKASLHYHFPSKAELGRVLIERYRSHFGAALQTIDQQTRDPGERLRRYVELYTSVLSNERMCLCGMLAAEYATLPEPMQEALKLFFDANERWLAVVLDEGRRAGALRFKESAVERARVLLGALEGAMLVARSYGDPTRFQSAAAHVLADLKVDTKGTLHRTSGTRATRVSTRA
jgi:TetR/AcrR family transcriptional regulator, transcriptional repressor for nem operon